jgi:hypothetical protein
MLYELLTGALPLDRRQLDHVELDEFRRMIREVDPPKPSTKLSSLGEDATRIASCRGADVRALTRALQRELEWIPLKAMRKEVASRYASACALAEDIRRYLAGLPLLLAGPPTILYRFRTYVRKHSSAGTAAVLLCVALANTSFTIFYAGHKIRSGARKATQMAAASQVGTLVEFLDWWGAGQTMEARTYLDKFTKGSPPGICVRFLLDPTEQNTTAFDGLRDNHPGLYWVISGDCHARHNRRDAALDAYRQCCRSSGDDSELSRWCRVRAQVRAVQLGAPISSLRDFAGNAVEEQRP